MYMYDYVTSSNNIRTAAIFELHLHPFMIHLYTKYHLNPLKYRWKNEQKLIFKKFSKSKGNNSFNNNWVALIFELDLHLFLIYLYTKYYLNPSNHHWENEQKLSYKFSSPRAITSPLIIGQHPYLNLTCISSWYITEKILSWVWRTDGWTDGEQDGHRHTIIRPVFNGRIKTTNKDVVWSTSLYLKSFRFFTECALRYA
jgi:hypothetical protein